MDRRFLTVLAMSIVLALVVSAVFYQMSARGLARELSHAFGGKFKDPGLGKAPKGTKAPAWPVTVVDLSLIHI